MEYEKIIAYPRENASKENLQGLARFGINTNKTLGVSMPKIRATAKKSTPLNKRACETAQEIGKIYSRSVKWIAKDILRELKSEKVVERIRQREKRRNS